MTPQESESLGQEIDAIVDNEDYHLLYRGDSGDGVCDGLTLYAKVQIKKLIQSEVAKKVIEELEKMVVPLEKGDSDVTAAMKAYKQCLNMAKRLAELRQKVAGGERS